MTGKDAALALVFFGVLVIWLGCNTCRPEQPAVQPTVGGAVGVGSGGISHAGGVGLDVSNLFCRAPDSETAPQPGPGSPPIQDPPQQTPEKPSQGDAR
jgi:hypothetical protein